LWVLWWTKLQCESFFFLEYVGGHLSVSFDQCSSLILSSAADVIYSCQLTVSVNNT
jgi:hypothetical protein